MIVSNTESYTLITGASAGIGKALAFEFARHKKNLVLIALPESGLEEIAASLKLQYNIMVHCFCVDLTVENAALSVLEWCQKNNYNINILVNNAGLGNLELFEHTQSSLLHHMMGLNNNALVMMTHYFIPELKKSRESYIMNLGSLASFMPIPSKSLYAATKSFVYSFSHSLYFELKPHNIHVSCLCPGGTSTEGSQAIDENNLNKSSFCQSPEAVAAEAVRKLFRKRFRIIPGWRNRMLYWLSQTLPEALKIKIITSVFKKKQAHGKMSLKPQASSVRSYAVAPTYQKVTSKP
jgi:short-subunit dehydrogenase